MTTSLHQVDPPALPVCDGRVVIGADAPSGRLRASAGFTNHRNDGWGPPRWAQAEGCTGGHRQPIAKALNTGTRVFPPQH